MADSEVALRWFERVWRAWIPLTVVLVAILFVIFASIGKQVVDDYHTNIADLKSANAIDTARSDCVRKLNAAVTTADFGAWQVVFRSFAGEFAGLSVDQRQKIFRDAADAQKVATEALSNYSKNPVLPCPAGG